MKLNKKVHNRARRPVESWTAADAVRAASAAVQTINSLDEIAEKMPALQAPAVRSLAAHLMLRAWDAAPGKKLHPDREFFEKGLEAFAIVERRLRAAHRLGLKLQDGGRLGQDRRIVAKAYEAVAYRPINADMIVYDAYWVLQRPGFIVEE